MGHANPARCAAYSGDADQPQSSQRQTRRKRPHRSQNGFDQYDYAFLAEPKPRSRPVADALSSCRVTDDWPEDIPVTPEEVDVFEAWFGDVLDKLFGE